MNKEIILSGDDAIGRGAIEAGISLATSYPGTPATEILTYIARNFSGDAEWSVNEKIAFETAIGASYAGKRAICSMKHVGLNVASDPLMTIAYLGIKGGLVLAVADDPGAYSSQNEQDSRFYAKFAKIPCLEPSDSQEAKDMTIMAFDLSEKTGLPVMLRTVTRISHAYSPVEIGEVREQNPLVLKKDPANMIAVPSNVLRCHRNLNEKQEGLRQWGEDSGLNKTLKNGQKKGIIACGIGYVYAREYGPEYAILKISYYPFADKLIEEFVKGLEEVWVLEEGEPFVEEIARRYSSRVKGKISGEIIAIGELGPDVITQSIPEMGKSRKRDKPSKPLPPRPPSMCPGCPHSKLYDALKLVAPAFTAGDIGCYTLGVNPPYQIVDTCLCMGAGISKAAGIAKQGVKRVAAVIGDSTFLHSGIPALINAVYNKANILVLILDNSAIAMTGNQPTPLTGINAKGEEGGKISLEGLCKSCGVNSVEVTDPYDVEKTEAILREKLDAEGVNVVISRRPCVFVTRRLAKMRRKSITHIRPEKKAQ
ncbi:MAG: thiamine pyrophosphate-dependent enzyme [Thermodesulfovibrionales bacterium]|nr:thiamine pyrophosphate-dependent enzyme [Thermodesulfovibrionales bacterium]